MSGFELYTILVNDNFDEFMDLDKEKIDFREPLEVSPNILPPILQHDASATAVCVFKGAEKCLSWIASNTDIKELYDLNGRTLFHFAAASSKPNIFSILEECSPEENQNIADEDGMLPIHYAAMFGNLKVLQNLWMNGSDLEAVTNNSQTLLDLAVLYWQPEIVNFLLANLELNEKHFHSIFYLESHSTSKYAFHGNTVQKAEQILNSFIKAGLDILTITNSQNKKLLFFYLEKNDLDMVKFLLQKIGKAEIKDENGLTPYEFARRYKGKEVTDFILENTPK